MWGSVAYSNASQLVALSAWLWDLKTLQQNRHVLFYSPLKICSVLRELSAFVKQLLVLRHTRGSVCHMCLDIITLIHLIRFAVIEKHQKMRENWHMTIDNAMPCRLICLRRHLILFMWLLYIILWCLFDGVDYVCFRTFQRRNNNKPHRQIHNTSGSPVQDLLRPLKYKVELFPNFCEIRFVLYWTLIPASLSNSTSASAFRFQWIMSL